MQCQVIKKKEREGELEYSSIRGELPSSPGPWDSLPLISAHTLAGGATFRSLLPRPCLTSLLYVALNSLYFHATCCQEAPCLRFTYV